MRMRMRMIQWWCSGLMVIAVMMQVVAVLVLVFVLAPLSTLLHLLPVMG